MRLQGVPEHELFANSFILEGEVADVIRTEWQLQPRDVVTLLSEKPRDDGSKILQSMLSGPIDIDKMDYLMRDSLHAGVPYGRNFDQQRLIGSLCLNAEGNGIALSEKGKTAAEMMVFSRYVMFSEVYWHHAVRSATAMLQRAFYRMHSELDFDAMFRMDERAFIETLRTVAQGGPAAILCDGLFGPKRRLYKRWLQYSLVRSPEIFSQLARRPYEWLVRCSEEVANRMSHLIGRRVAPDEILIDAPPVKLEVQFAVDIFFPKEDIYRPLGDVSPMVKTLATTQFDDHVKSVRVFVAPRLRQDLADVSNEKELLESAISAVG